MSDDKALLDEQVAADSPPEAEARRPLGADELILERTDKRIALFEQAGGTWRFAASLKSISEDTAQEYEGRAILELIQNGHDALLDGTPGRLKVLLDLGSPQPTVYAANEGEPFNEANFNAITEFALSNKAPGEGIGNKGLGFRSVLQLTDWPEVYSKSVQASPSFDGFSFRFATPADIGERVDSEELAARVISEISPLFLPIPAHADDPIVAEFADAGYASVIRLPLRNATATEAALAQIQALASSETPLLLFLDRIAELDLEIRHDDGTVDRHRLARAETRSNLLAVHTDEWVREVDLGGEGRYLLARRAIAADEMNDAIERSIQAREVDERWLGAGGNASVAIAVRLDLPLSAGRLYTFLPMAAPAPLCVHAHAPFFTKLARLDISRTNELNAYLLDQLADLALQLARRLRDEAPYTAAAGLVLDLICWDRPERIDRACEGQLGKEPIVPLAGNHRWGSLEDSYVWPDRDWKVLTPGALARIGAEVLDPSVGPERQRRVSELHRRLIRALMNPPEDVAAQWAELIAKSMQRGTNDQIHTGWADFYDDLAQAFTLSPAALRGKEIILGHDGVLKPALGGGERPGRAAPSVFLSPEEAATDAAPRIPAGLKALQRRIAFTHPQITWNSQGRIFLEKNQLVREYRTERVLDALRDLLADAPSEALCRETLAFAARQFSTLTATQRAMLARIAFRIPLANGGWELASSCLLSPGWGTDIAQRTDRFLTEGGTTVAELADLTKIWIAPPNAWPFPLTDDLETTRAFLNSIGVRDGLEPTTHAAPRALLTGAQLSPRRLSLRYGFDDGLTQCWTRDVEDVWSGGRHPNTIYEFTRTILTLRGAHQVESLSPELRRQFAELVLLAFRSWPDSYFSITVQRPNRVPGQQDPHEWPSPLTSYLRHQPWLPVASSNPDPLSFVAPHQAWHCINGETPQYLPSPQTPLRRLLTDQRTLRRLRELGLRIWDDPAHSGAAVRALGAALADGAVAEHQIANFKKNYAAAWTQAVGQREWPWADTDPVSLAVERGSILTAVTASDDQDLYIVDESAALKESLVAFAGHSVLITEPRSGGKVAELFETRDLPVSRLSEADVKILDGDQQITAAEEHPLLTDDRPWLPLVTALVAELKSGPFVRRGTLGVRSVVELMRSIRLARANHVDILVDGARAQPSHTIRSLPLPDQQHPTIVVWGETDGWEELQACSPALAQLLGQPGLRDALELTFVKLQRLVDHEDSEGITDTALAEALDVPASRVTELRRSLVGGLADLVHLIRPLLAHDRGPTRLDEIEALLSNVRTASALQTLLEPWAAAHETTAQAIIEQARQCTTPSDLRDALSLDFAAFNDALIALGAPYAPITHPDLHEHAFTEFLREHTPMIIERLREHFQPAAERGEDITGYVHARQFDGLGPDPAWLPRFRTPPHDLMSTSIKNWLRTYNADDDLNRTPKLEALSTLRARNYAAVETLVEKLTPLISAWCRARDLERPAPWALNPLEVSRTALDASGLADLVILGEEQLLDLVADTLGWPVGMNRTTSNVELGIEPADLRPTPAPAPLPTGSTPDRSTITIGDTLVKVGTSNLTEVVEAARASLDESFVKQKAAVQLGAPDGPKSNRTGGSRAEGLVVLRAPRYSDDQRSAVGLTGEVLAKAWLEPRHPGGVYWRSGYAAIIENAPGASDALGYDFEVVWRKTTLFYEVKAHVGPVGPSLEFELGESELQAAQHHARNSRYRILLITSVLEPDDRRIFELPNPFSTKTRGMYQVIGRGLRYRCNPANNTN